MSLIQLIRRYERKRRFWRFVRVGGRDDCWPWLGETDREGYGWVDGQQAHERAFQLSGGTLPVGTSLEHRCGNPRCVNPHHLAVEDGRSHREADPVT